MSQMRDSTLDPRYIAEQIRANPPKKLDNGNIFSGLVRLTFPNLFKPRDKKQEDDGGGKFGTAVLFPLGANLDVFSAEWHREARTAFPKYFDASGRMIAELHSPFHDQATKTVGAKPLLGYTPGAYFMNVASSFKPQVVDTQMNPIVDENRVYPGVWAFLALNVYHYSNKKTGVGFGLQSVMIVADDTRLGGGGSDPRADFAGITLTATSNVADKFNTAPVLGASPIGGVMPTGGFVGQPGGLPVQPLPSASVEDLY